MSETNPDYTAGQPRITGGMLAKLANECASELINRISPDAITEQVRDKIADVPHLIDHRRLSDAVCLALIQKAAELDMMAKNVI